jgi:tetratricopeptide (TPR) repeat protein
VDELEQLVDRSPGLAVWKARLALWRTRPSEAEKHLNGLPPSADVRCLEAVCALQRGALQDAEDGLRRLLDTDARSEAWGWLATVLRKQGRYADAVRAAEEGNRLGTEFNLALRLERELSADLEAAGMRRIKDLRHAWALHPFGLGQEDSVSTIEPLLERIGGNHTPYVTTADQGRLVAHPLPIDPGQVGVSVQRVLWTRGPEAVRALYRDLGARLDDHPSFRVYEGEFELWMGEYDRAAEIFRAALDRDPHVKWAWIGLGASASLKGNFAEAQAIWAEGVSITSAGPTLYVYRGECHRRQGDVASARQDLAQAIREKPHRVSGRFNLALLERDATALDRAVGECLTLAPFLMDELDGDPAEKLEGVLAAMRGNRSSSIVSYHLWGRVWRAVTR